MVDAPTHKPESSREDEVNQIDLKNRHAVVTGGAQGIGLSIATRLQASGASVSIWDYDRAVLEASILELGKAGQVTGEVVDVSDASSVDRAVESTINTHRKIDILVANAGIAGPNHKTWEYPVEEWQRVVNVNLLGVFYCCRAILPHMLRENYGRIVNVASVAGKEGKDRKSVV